MASVIKTKAGREVIDYMAKDYESFRQAMIDLIPKKLPEWTDRSEADFGIVLIELFAYMADILSYYQDRIANESFLATAQERRSIIHHLRLIGYELAPAAPASALLTLIVSNDEKDTIQINKGDQFATKSSSTEEDIIFEYTREQPLSINLNNLQKDSAGEGFKKYVGIPVQEGKTVPTNGEEKLGISDGSPNQSFRLSKPKMIKGSLKIWVKTPAKIDTWELRSSLIFSQHNDKHYFIETDENDYTTVYFGDNVYGQIPEIGAEIIATYRVGGGAGGNVGSNKITVISKSPQLQSLSLPANVTNEIPASGGKDRESIEHAIKFAPKVFRSLNRAVTEKDFINLALSYPGVAKARAVSSGWNKVTLYIVPESVQCQKPTDTFKEELIGFFEDKRMVGTFVNIQDPICVPFDIWLKVTVAYNYFADEIKKRVEEAIKALFKLDNVDFGQSMYLSKVYEAVEALDGVDDTYVYLFNRRDELEFKDKRKVKDGVVKLDVYEIPILGKLYIRAEGGLLREEGSS